MHISADHSYLPEDPHTLLAFPHRVGILGGTFNPIHVAHIEAARQVRGQFSLDEVIILPSGQPPHKGDEVISAGHRLSMVHLAADGVEGLRVSDDEVRREGTTYTVDTLRALHAQFMAQTAFFYIIGADTLPEIISWKESREVVRLCEFIALYRPGVLQDMDRLCEDFMLQFPEAKLHVARFEGLDISSSDIRARIAMGLPIDHLVSPGVHAYIRMHGLYKQPDKEHYS